MFGMFSSGWPRDLSILGLSEGTKGDSARLEREGDADPDKDGDSDGDRRLSGKLSVDGDHVLK